MSASSVVPPPSSSSSSSSQPSNLQQQSLPSPPPPPVFNTPEEQTQYELHQRKMRDYAKFKHYAAVTGIVLAPTLAIMPPRKFDLYTVALVAGFVASTSQLSKERYGMGLIDLAGAQLVQYRERQIAEGKASTTTLEKSSKQESSSWTTFASSLPTEKAQQYHQAQLQASRQQQQQQDQPTNNPNDKPEKRSLLQRLWLGNESANWREERAREHAEALERGETIGDLIRAQVDEVWNWGSGGGSKEKEKGKGENDGESSSGKQEKK